jgi:hypothetical protein
VDCGSLLDVSGLLESMISWNQRPVFLPPCLRSHPNPCAVLAGSGCYSLLAQLSCDGILNQMLAYSDLHFGPITPQMLTEKVGQAIVTWRRLVASGADGGGTMPRTNADRDALLVFRPASLLVNESPVVIAVV